MLATGNRSLENIEVSISLSIKALPNTEAVQLLATLYQLPDGLYLWEECLPFSDVPGPAWAGL
jgi:hypothetical protein